MGKNIRICFNIQYLTTKLCICVTLFWSNSPFISIFSNFPPTCLVVSAFSICFSYFSVAFTFFRMNCSTARGSHFMFLQPLESQAMQDARLEAVFGEEDLFSWCVHSGFSGRFSTLMQQTQWSLVQAAGCAGLTQRLCKCLL